MKSRHLISLLPCIWMTACCTLECVGPLDRNIKPLSYYWEKDIISEEQKTQDWIACGGMGDGGYATPDRLPEEKDDFSASSRVFDQIQRCMLKKDYDFTGECESEIRKASPACGAP